MKKDRIIKILLLFFLIFIIAFSVYFLFHNFSSAGHREGRVIRTYVQSFGIFAPFIIIFLIFLSTAIPPLPLPVPLIEVVAGITFGFLEGAFIVWLSQIGSSILAFYITRIFKKNFFGVNVLKSNKWDFYKFFLQKKGGLAIFLIRFTMAAPFNIISYLAGLTQINILNFTIATALGTIPESLLYTFLGSQIRTLHIKFIYLSIAIVVIGCMGFVFTLILMFLLGRKGVRKQVI